MGETLVALDALIDLVEGEGWKVQVRDRELLTWHEGWNHDVFTAVREGLHVVWDLGPYAEQGQGGMAEPDI